MISCCHVQLSRLIRVLRHHFLARPRSHREAGLVHAPQPVLTLRIAMHCCVFIECAKEQCVVLHSARDLVDCAVGTLVHFAQNQRIHPLPPKEFEHRVPQCCVVTLAAAERLPDLLCKFVRLLLDKFCRVDDDQAPIFRPRQSGRLLCHCFRLDCSIRCSLLPGLFGLLRILNFGLCSHLLLVPSAQLRLVVWHGAGRVARAASDCRVAILCTQSQHRRGGRLLTA
mmetsp:Transcript_91566/g.133870  ORF Transcript_91566/g.133870 Transcript_91566/m.133870 type:complete len:226 (-) Transcript_91566:423-1100(-)